MNRPMVWVALVASSLVVAFVLRAGPTSGIRSQLFLDWLWGTEVQMENAAATSVSASRVSGHGGFWDWLWSNTPKENYYNAAASEPSGYGECETASDCADNNDCTDDLCSDFGECIFEPIANCGCTINSECDDMNVCTVDVCLNNNCEHQPAVAQGCPPPEPPVPPGAGCETAADCNDMNNCTWDACCDQNCDPFRGPYCVHSTIISDSCATCPFGDNEECDDSDVCTVDTCVQGDCMHTEYPACQTDCITAAECDDHQSCTADECIGGACHHTLQPDAPGCEPCGGAPLNALCNDGDVCTVDTCRETEDGGSGCIFTDIEGCRRPCAGSTDSASCDDGYLCTVDMCIDGFCHNAAIADCEDSPPPA